MDQPLRGPVHVNRDGLRFNLMPVVLTGRKMLNCTRRERSAR